MHGMNKTKKNPSWGGSGILLIKLSDSMQKETLNKINCCVIKYLEKEYALVSIVYWHTVFKFLSLNFLVPKVNKNQGAIEVLKDWLYVHEIESEIRGLCGSGVVFHSFAGKRYNREIHTYMKAYI